MTKKKLVKLSRSRVMVVRIGPLENLLHLHLHEANPKKTVSELFFAKGIVLRNEDFLENL